MSKAQSNARSRCRLAVNDGKGRNPHVVTLHTRTKRGGIYADCSPSVATFTSRATFGGQLLSCILKRALYMAATLQAKSSRPLASAQLAFKTVTISGPFLL